MVFPGHICPFGLKSKDLLEHEGYEVEDHHLTDRAATDAFKAEHDVKTTPLTFIDGTKVGGYDDLRRFFGKKVQDKDAPSYTPVIAIFAMAFFIALAMTIDTERAVFVGRLIERFFAVAMALLAVQKLQNIETFSTMFLNYDVLARKHVRYAYLYPFLEALAAVLMIAGILTWISAPIALVIGGVGAWSVYQAVYVEKRSLKCACVGAGTNVPLGPVSLAENLIMVGMGLWMPLRMYVFGL
ncbi:MauE/DoxX family redox-associated membrane protein [Aquimixticola soesokkakensis]|nr:glutaredoxin [Aquimixticola soesokkakensis]